MNLFSFSFFGQMHIKVPLIFHSMECRRFPKILLKDRPVYLEERNQISIKLPMNLVNSFFLERIIVLKVVLIRECHMKKDSSLSYSDLSLVTGIMRK